MQTLGNFISRLYYFSYSPRFLSTFKSLLSDLKELQFCSLCILYACFMHAWFMHSFCVVIILFHTDLYKSAFLPILLKNLFFAFVFYEFFVYFSISSSETYCICIIIVSISIKCSVILILRAYFELSNNASFFFPLYTNYL